LSDVVESVRFYDGDAIREFGNEECQFRYRESVFKRRKDWIIFRVTLRLREGDATALRRRADEILSIRNAKFPPTMKCAGSIFKNLLLKDLPSDVASAVPEDKIKGGKVPAAFFLEQVGAKDSWEGRIHVAPYHANLVYNAGGGTAVELRRMIANLKAKVQEQFGITIEEEVQYLGFPEPGGIPDFDRQASAST
jgi:UDP-N-acetylmuramate dehydrogenase